MRDIIRILFYSIPVTGFTFISGTNPQSFFSGNNVVQAEKDCSIRRESRNKDKAYDFWKHGEYTDLLLGWKRKDGDVEEEVKKEEVKD